MRSKGWVLVTDGKSAQGRDCLATVRALHAAGYRVAVTASGRTSRFARSRYCDRVIPVPEVGTEGYVPAVHAELERNEYVAVLHASEDAFLALGPDFQHLTEKAGLEEASRAAGLPTPPSRSFANATELLASSDAITYPAVVKPMIRFYNAFYATGPADLAEASSWGGEILVQPFVDEPLHVISGIVWKGEIAAAVHERWQRIWPVPCGLASAAETIAPDPKLEAGLLRVLDGYEGIFCAQFIGPYLIDINLRMYSTHPLAVKAGVNLAGLYCDLVRGAEVSGVRARPGSFFRWLEGDIRHVIHAKKTGRMSLRDAVSALRPRLRAAHSTESLTDPGPLLSRVLYASGRVHMSMDERKRVAA